MNSELPRRRAVPFAHFLDGTPRGRRCFPFILWILMAPVGALCQQLALDDLAGQVRVLNAEIARGASGAVEPARLAEALKTRASRQL